MLTVDFERLAVRAGDRVLDLGCGGGRHAFEMYRRGARVIALDRDPADLVGVATMFAAMAAAGEAPAGATATVLRADARSLPFPDDSFDTVVVSEVLEHVTDDRRVIDEIARVARPGSAVAVTVPRWWPERICWWLSHAYHAVDGGHVRIYRRAQLLRRLRAASLELQASHHAHALHAPYWWLRCLFGPDNDDALLPRLYHRFLVYDILRRPWWTRGVERLLNPFLGKSLVVYVGKPERVG
jgi:SAM-dependent methyltransferase